MLRPIRSALFSLAASLSLLAQQAAPYSWRNVEIVGGGFIPGIVAHPAQQGLLYARTDIGGAYRWDPPSSRWIPLNDWIDKDHWNYTGIESIGLDPNDPTRLYLAGGTYIQSWASTGAIFRSTDQGATFQMTPMPFKMGGNEDGRHAGERLAVDPADGSKLWFGSRNAGLWRSTDWGATWSKVSTFPDGASGNNIGLVFVAFDNTGGADGSAPETIYVGASDPKVGLYVSKDDGATWQPVSGQPTGLLPNHGVFSASDGVLYLTYGDQPGPNNMNRGAVWKYDTRAGAWTEITPVQPTSRIPLGYGSIALDAQNPGTLMVATMDRWTIGDDIYRSTDGGAHWTGLSAKSQRDDSPSPWITFGGSRSSFGWWIGNITIDPFNPAHVLYTTGATIWGTDDATNADSGTDPIHWSPRAQGLEETAVLDLISPPAGANLISAVGDIGGFRHDDLAVTPPRGMFVNPVFTTTTSLAYAELNPSVVVRVGSAGTNVRRGAISADGGTTWKPFATEPRGSQGAGTISIAADGSVIVWTPQSNGAVSVSTDQGTTWSTASGISAASLVTADRVNPAKFYGFDNGTSRIVMSSDGGQTFMTRSLPLQRGNPVLRAVPGIEGDLWLASAGSFQHSTDGGATWIRQSSVQSVDSFGFGKSATDGGYPAIYIIGQVSGQKAIFRSDDAAATWTRINDDQHQYSTSGVIIGDPRIYGRVYIGNNGRGVIYGDPVASQPTVARSKR